VFENIQANKVDFSIHCSTHQVILSLTVGDNCRR